MHQPLIDRDQIEQVMRSAKAARIRYLREKSADAARSARWGGLAVLMASALALFGGHRIGHWL